MEDFVDKVIVEYLVNYTKKVDLIKNINNFKHMDKYNYLKLSFNLNPPCLRAIIYEVFGSITNFANCFANCSNYQRYSILIAL